MTSRQPHKILTPLLWLTLLAPGISACQTELDDSKFGATDRSATYVSLPHITPERSEVPGPTIAFEQMIDRLADKRVVFVGERHDRFDHHQNQLAVIRALHERNPNLAIGMEFFQRPFQPYLDQYVRDEIDQREMLRLTEYYLRWKYDFRLYAPILEYARENDIPVVALNLPPEITGPVGSGDFDSLTIEQLEELPQDMDREVPGYTERLETIFNYHPVAAHGSEVDRFLEVQLLWDEGMADRVATYLKDHPRTQMVVLAGSGHVAYGTGIPTRVARRLQGPMAIVVNDDGIGLSRNVADYVLLSEEASLPKAGMLGVMINTTDEGVVIRSFAEDSAAREAGLAKGDRIMRIAGHLIEDYEDVKLAMWDKAVGQDVAVAYQREEDVEPVEVTVELR
jgi:uncharacterized iron-regulated protein